MKLGEISTIPSSPRKVQRFDGVDWRYAPDVDRQAVAAVAALHDPTRAALFEWVQAAAGPVTRDDAARGVGISRKLAAFHLDRLVDAGLLTAGAAQVRRVGRSPKTYARSTDEVQVCVPPREHGELAELLLEAISAPGAAPSDAAMTVAAERGRALGSAAARERRLGRLGPERALTVSAEILTARGYEPLRDANGIRLRNCPFHPMARQHAELVCGMNHALIAGVLAGLNARGVTAELVPDPELCCVRVRREGSAPATRPRD
jgi:predicted ArsR family transcriptional regulator